MSNENNRPGHFDRQRTVQRDNFHFQGTLSDLYVHVWVCRIHTIRHLLFWPMRKPLLTMPDNFEKVRRNILEKCQQIT